MCGPADGPATKFVIGIESGRGMPSTLKKILSRHQSLGKTPPWNSDVPVSLTQGGHNFHDGQGEPRTAVDGEVTVPLTENGVRH